MEETNSKRGWIYTLNKEQLITWLDKFSLDTEGSINYLSRRLKYLYDTKSGTLPETAGSS